MRILRIILGCSFLVFVSVLLVGAATTEDPQLSPSLPGGGRPVHWDKRLGLGYVGSPEDLTGAVGPKSHLQPGGGRAGTLRRPPSKKAREESVQGSGN